jgi:hypothetical protein
MNEITIDSTQERLIEHMNRGGSLTEFSRKNGIAVFKLIEILGPARHLIEKNRRNHFDERWLEEICSLCFWQMDEIYDKNGKIKPLHQWGVNASRAVQEVRITPKTDEEGNVSHSVNIKFSNKVQALKLVREMLNTGEIERRPTTLRGRPLPEDIAKEESRLLIEKGYN